MKRIFNSVNGRVLLSVLSFMLICTLFVWISFSMTNNLEDVETVSIDLKENVQSLYEELLVTDYVLIDSDEYLVADDFITMIEPNTTISDFFEKFNVTDFSVTENDVEVIDGIVKTGMVLTYGGDSYTLIVMGDLNKDGLLNYVDASMIIDNSKNVEINKESFLASDINEDGIVDREDVLCFVDYIFNGTLEKNEIIKVDVPTLEIVEGSKTDDEWYQGSVTIKFNSNGAEYGAYKIEGTKEDVLYNVSDGTEITLSSGAYKIIAWNYASDGGRSDSVSYELKIDEVEKFRYSFEEDKLYLREYLGTLDMEKDLVIPATYYGYPVYGVGHEDAVVYLMNDTDSVYVNIFNKNIAYCESIEDFFVVINSITIEEGIKHIGNVAFMGLYVMSGDLIIPDSVDDLGMVAFAFSGVNLLGNVGEGNVIVGSGIKEFKYGAFNQVYATGSFYIPENVTVIGPWSFAYSSFGENIRIGENISSIGAGAFSDFSSGIEFTGTMNADFVGESAFGYAHIVSDFVINSESVSTESFSRAILDGDLIFSDNVKEIGSYSFYNTDINGSIKFGNSLETIQEYAFTYANLGNGEILLPNSVKTIGEYAFHDASFSGDLIIPDSVIKIEHGAFQNSGFNGTFSMSSDLSDVGSYAFADNPNLVGTVYTNHFTQDSSIFSNTGIIVKPLE